MITEAFDNLSPAIINPQVNENAPVVDGCIVTFSHEIERFVVEHYNCEQIGKFYFATGETPVYRLTYRGKTFTFYKTYVGAPACVGTVEDTLALIKTKNYIVFGGAGCLSKEIARGKVMVPTAAYRDEGTSYHYAPASDYITVKNAPIVEQFMQKAAFPMCWAKHGRPTRSTARRSTPSPATRQTAASPWRWSAPPCKPCAIFGG